LWAGKPFVWQIYPQDDQAHHAKLQAFCKTLQMPHDLAATHSVWNGITHVSPWPLIVPSQMQNWTLWARQTVMRLEGQQDLVTQLEQFVSQKR
jgi:hypothetical protein